jgi:hypothetical protein
MQELSEHLKSSDFWIFSVVFAIVLSVLGNYATRFVDRALRLGTSTARALSTRGREKRIARMKHINEWIDSHENGAILVLSEAHFLCFLGMTMAILVVSTLLFGRVAIAASSSLLHGLLAAGCLATIVIALAAMNLGGTLLDAVRRHPKGLAGLNQNK